MQDEFPEVYGTRLKIEPLEDPGTTGNFEVTIQPSGELIHSKKRGKGRCESKEEQEALFDIVRDKLGL